MTSVILLLLYMDYSVIVLQSNVTLFIFAVLVVWANRIVGDRSFSVTGPRVWNNLPAARHNTEQTVAYTRFVDVVELCCSQHHDRGHGVFVTFQIYLLHL